MSIVYLCILLYFFQLPFSPFPSPSLSLSLPTYKVLLLAMKDMNVAKLTAADLPLFNGITADLFPGIDVPILDYGIVCNPCAYLCAHAHIHTSWYVL